MKQLWERVKEVEEQLKNMNDANIINERLTDLELCIFECVIDDAEGIWIGYELAYDEKELKSFHAKNATSIKRLITINGLLELLKNGEINVYSGDMDGFYFQERSKF